MLMEIPSGVRTGTWTKEEDDLLRTCIQRYGEGKWNLVPQRASLNRCRKSCRLRWMNYLKPDIKRGNFIVDEANMIMRFHRLLGNRYSLIAARFQGRTANDVKNYWNSHMRRKVQHSASCSQIIEKKKEKPQHHDHNNKVIIIRPQPLNLWRKKPQGDEKPLFADNNNNDDDSTSKRRRRRRRSPTPSEKVEEGVADSAQQESSEISKWWESLLHDVNIDIAHQEEEEHSFRCLWV